MLAPKAVNSLSTSDSKLFQLKPGRTINEDQTHDYEERSGSIKKCGHSRSNSESAKCFADGGNVKAELITKCRYEGDRMTSREVVYRESDGSIEPISVGSDTESVIRHPNRKGTFFIACFC